MAPIDLWKSVINRFYKQPEKKPFTPTTAALLSIGLTILYIAPFYLSSATRPSPTLSRDAPSSIRARIRAITFSGIASSIAVILLITHYTTSTALEALALLGWYPFSLLDILKTLLLTAVLFAGPLFEAGIVSSGWKDWITLRHVPSVLGSWTGYRNYIAGPISEEIIWRSLLIPLHVLTPLTPLQITFLVPLYFGIAHAHHYYEFRITHPHVPRAHAILRAVFQFTYTSVFGFYATFVFLRNRSVIGLILAHSFCNWMGLPRVWGRVGLDEGDLEPHIGPPVGGDGGGPHNVSRDDTGTQGSKQRRTQRSRGVGWTVAYYILLVAGAIGFWKMLWVLTESDHKLADFGTK